MNALDSSRRRFLGGLAAGGGPSFLFTSCVVLRWSGYGRACTARVMKTLFGSSV